MLFLREAVVFERFQGSYAPLSLSRRSPLLGVAST
jgi:hypothetical protein